MSERRTHAQKAAGFVKEMMGFVEDFKKATPCSREQYRNFLLVNQAWKCAEVHAQEALMPDTTRLLRKATKIRMAVNKAFFNSCVGKS
jgi:hypothetical protein